MATRMPQPIRSASPDQISHWCSALPTVLDCSPDPLFLLDSETRIQMLNKAATLYCRTATENVLGRPCAEIIRHNDTNGFASNVTETIRTGKPITWDRKKTTPPCCLEEVTLLPLTPIADTEPGIIVHIRDITREEKINELMMSADRMATLNRLASGISHQMRNPLSAIMLFTDILADEKRFTRSDQELDLLADINNNVRTVTDIITRALGFTDGNASPVLSVDINGMIRDILQLWSPLLKRAGIKADFSPRPDLPCVAGDRVKLGQAVGSLVRNAMEAMKDGGTLTLTTTRTQSAQNEEKVVITCTDTGPGIDEELKNFIFDPFFSTRQGNSGMGLTIARLIVNRYGGRIFRQSARAGKTVFCIELPLAPEPQANETNP